MDHRKELLRTQAVQACLSAMGAAEARIYGHEPHQWCGTVLDDDSTMTSTTHWRDTEGSWKYEVQVAVTVYKTKVPE